MGATSKGLVGADRRHVRGGPAAGRGGDHDRRQRHHAAQRHRAFGATAGQGGPAIAASGAVVVVGTCPDFGVITAIPQPLRWVTRSRGLRLARAQASAVRAAGGVPVPFSDLLAPEFRKAPELFFSQDMFHPSAAGYALAAKQLLPALCNALAEFVDGSQPEEALESRSADGGSLLARVGEVEQAVAPLHWGPRAHRGARELRVSSVSRSIRGVPMAEAVIVSTARSPIGRAVKGSLVNMRPDDLAAQMVRAALDKVPALDPKRHRRPDDGLRAARRRGRLQHRPRGGRRARLRLPARHHGQPVLLVVAADHPDGVPRDQGGRGRRVRLRGCGDGVAVRRRAADGAPDSKNALFGEAQAAHARKQRPGADEWHDPREDGEIPDVYIAMGQTAENVALLTGISREDQDHWGVRSQNRAEEAIKSGFFEREIVPVTLPDGSTVSTDDGPRAGTTYEAVSQLKPVFRPNGTITAGNACPLNDGAAAVVIMSDTKAKELGLTPLARIVSTGVSGLSPEIMGLGPIEAITKALAKAGKTISDIDLVRDQRGVRRPGARLRARVGHGRGQAQRVRRRDRAGASVRHDGRPDHRHAAE